MDSLNSSRAVCLRRASGPDGGQAVVWDQVLVAVLELTILGVVPAFASLAGGAIIAAAAIYIARREAQVGARPLVAESKTFPKT